MAPRRRRATTIAGLRPGDDLATALDYVEVTSNGAAGQRARRQLRHPRHRHASAQGYVLAFVDGTLTVDPASLTVTVDDAARTLRRRQPGLLRQPLTASCSATSASDLDGALAFAPPPPAAATSAATAITGSGLEVPERQLPPSAYRAGHADHRPGGR